MTTSRDSASTNSFPGEVRAGELARIRRMVAEHVRGEDGVDATTIVAGDFNTSAIDVHVFQGNLASSDGKAISVDTGFSGGRLDWTDCTGRKLTLYEAFADSHKWGSGVGPGKNFSSWNADRCTVYVCSSPPHSWRQIPALPYLSC